VAEDDLCEVYAYIARESVAAAEKMWERFTRIFEMLARQPLIGEACEALTPNLRCFPVGRYVVYYRAEETGVVVVRVCHGARDSSSLF
jgi:toxin ParE1/3/4